MTKECLHKHIQYDKLGDYNYCEECLMIFDDEEEILFREENIDNSMVDEVHENLSKLNNL